MFVINRYHRQSRTNDTYGFEWRWSCWWWSCTS